MSWLVTHSVTTSWQALGSAANRRSARCSSATAAFADGTAMTVVPLAFMAPPEPRCTVTSATPERARASSTLVLSKKAMLMVKVRRVTADDAAAVENSVSNTCLRREEAALAEYLPVQSHTPQPQPQPQPSTRTIRMGEWQQSQP